jgi:mitogen-activated protein kinase organizer 1
VASHQAFDRSTLTLADLLFSYRGHSLKDFKIECSFSFDGAFVLSGSEDGKVYWWDLVDAKQRHSLVAHKNPVRALACHPESSMFVTGCVDGAAKVWSTD